MERLSDKAIEIINDLHTERLDYTSEYLPLIEAAQKLAAYEDTEMEPEEIVSVQEEPWCVFYANKHCNLDGDFCQGKWECQMRLSPEDSVRLMKLAQAEKGGRLEVLPCKVGQDVFYLNEGFRNEICPATVVGIEINGHTPQCPVWLRIEYTSQVIGKHEYFCRADMMLGKTVFLTQAKAEEESKKRRKKNDDLRP